MRYLAHTLIAGLLAVLVACGAAPTAGAPPSQPANPPTQISPAPTLAPTQVPAPTATAGTPATPQPTAAATDIVVVFHRSGGIAGIDETLTIYADGHARLRARTGEVAAQIDPAALAELRQLLASPEFAALAPRYQAMGADLFIYEIAVPGGAQPRTVVTMDGANNPPALVQALEQLGKLREQVR